MANYPSDEDFAYRSAGSRGPDPTPSANRYLPPLDSERGHGNRFHPAAALPGRG